MSSQLESSGILQHNNPLEQHRVLLPVVVATLAIIFATVVPCVFGGFVCMENPCMHGICIDTLQFNSSHQCYCRNGFTGYSCQINWDECRSNPCLNGGSCVDGVASFNCSCPDNFAGVHCEVDLSVCEEAFPCQNNGTCGLNATGTGFTCSCQPGFSGSQCEVDISMCNATENVCQNGGKCVDGVGDKFYCSCEPGWSGETCHIDIDECESQPCQNGGICVNKINDFSCACPFGFTGRACETKLRICEENPCLNEGFCLNEQDDERKKTCYCVPDYHGTLCEFRYDDCEPPPKCFNGGTCIDGVGEFSCSCPPDFFGPTCQCTLENVTEPECAYNGTTFSETVAFPSPTSTMKLILTPTPSVSIPPFSSDILSSSSFQIAIPSSELVNETATPEETATPAELLPATSTLSVPFPSQSPYDPGGGDGEGSRTPSLPEATLIEIDEESMSSPGIPVQPQETFSISQTPLHTPTTSPGPVDELPVPSESEKVYTTTFFDLDSSEGTFPPGSSLDRSRSSILRTPLLSFEESPIPESTITMPQQPQPSSSTPDEESSDIIDVVIKDTARASLELTPTPTLPFSSEEVTSGMGNLSSDLPSERITYPHGVNTADLTAYVPPSTPRFSTDIVVEEEETDSLSTLLPSPSPSTTTLIIIATPEPSEIESQTLPYPVTTSFISSSSLLPSPSETYWIVETLDELVPPTLTPRITTSSVSLHPSDMLSAQIGDEESPVASPSLAITPEMSRPSVELTPALKPSPVPGESSSIFGVSSFSSFDYDSITTTIYSEQEPEASVIVSVTPTPDLPPTSSSSPPPPTAQPNLTDPCANYCHNNAKCVADSIEPICLCSFKFTGNRCEVAKEKFRASSFTGDSFLSFRVSNESIISKVDIESTLVTIVPEGILLYTGVGRMYALIFTQNGHVTLHFSCGSQSMHFVETRTRVDNGFNFTLVFRMEMIVQGGNELRCSAEVSVNQSYVMKGEQVVGREGVPLAGHPIETVHLGGVPPFHSDATLNDDLVGILPGFRGCLHNLMINKEQKDIYEDALDGKEVAECSSFGCVANPCYGSAQCLTKHTYPFWECMCSQGYDGLRCQIIKCSNNPCENGATCTYSPDSLDQPTFVNSSTAAGGEENDDDAPTTELVSTTMSPSFPKPICLCPLGFSGSVCQHKINVTKPAFRPQAGYSSFIAYDPIPRFIDWFQLKFHFVTKNITQIALLLYSGNNRGPRPLVMHGGALPSSSTTPPPTHHNSQMVFGFDQVMVDTRPEPVSDFFAITFVQGYIALTWNLGSGTQRITTPSRIDNRLNIHTLFAGRSGRQAWLKVDGMRNVTGQTPGPLYRLNADSNELYIGGYKTFKFEGLSHDLPLHQGFQGCIFDLGCRVRNRLYLPRPISGRSVKNCFEEDC